MKFQGTIRFFEYWHAGSGMPGIGDVDDTPVRDRHGLPYLPGKTLKGLLHEAFCELAAWGAVPSNIRPTAGMIQRLFGSESNRGRHDEGLLRFSNAVLPEDLAAHICHKGMQDGLYEILSATAIEEAGVAQARSLRRFEVAIPIELTFTIHASRLPEDFSIGRLEAMLAAACSLVRRAGKFRNNGFGRCKLTLQGKPEPAVAAPNP